MKGMAGRFRLSRKFVFILGGLLLLGGTTGAAAVYIGADRILGPSYQQLNGAACTSVTTVNIKKKDRFWVRKFIRTEATDGLTRVRTALRVAQAAYEKDKPDLVQVIVLDSNGPTDRAAMRGRSVGADVIYIAHPEKIPEDSQQAAYSAYYSDALPSSGQFYGQRIDMPLDDIKTVIAALNDKAGCTDPVVAGSDTGHGSSKKPTTGHDAPSGHDAAAGHGEAAPEEHAAAEPVAEGSPEAEGSSVHPAPEPEQPAEPATH